MRPRVLQLYGWSGSGKTTLAAAIIRRASGSGRRVHAVKHSHHPVGRVSGGDTGRYLAAGAAEVVLTNDSDAVRWTAESTAQPFEMATFAIRDYLASGADVIILEGYKSLRLGDVIVRMHDGTFETVSVLIAQTGDVQDHPASAETLLDILDTIPLS